MRYHIVGIAGSGMSAIAHLLLDQGHEVSGSDLVATYQTARLAERGARLFVGHAAAQVQGADAVLTTSAARPEHVELVAARASGLPVLKRADLWREWSAQRDVVAVAGTHGKTTTTAMIALALEQAGLDPGYLIGAEVPDLAAPARWGTGPLIVEADEYDHTFLALTPQFAVITNIGWDHVDCYPDAPSYRAAFRQFAAQTQAALIGCSDDAGVRALRETRAGPFFQGYGEGSAADWRIVDDLDAPEPRWELHSPLGHAVPFALALPGAHNRLNAAAATATCALLGLAPEATLHVLSQYQGARRRFEWKGEAGGVVVIDDYAHHPREAQATLAAARERYPTRRLVVYLQPHTYSRTRTFLNEWAGALSAADLVLVGEIFGAREQTDAAISHTTLAASIGGRDTRAVGDTANAAATLLTLLQAGDVLLTLGAGDGYNVGEQVLAALHKRT